MALNIKLATGLFIILLISFNLIGPNNSSKATNGTTSQADTLIGSKNITNEISGSAYRKRAKGYFVIVGHDTSDFTCIFAESKTSGKVYIDLNLPYRKKEMSYRQRMFEIKRILSTAAKDFNLDSLASIYVGRLVQNGDLAIDVTKQYRQKFGASNRITDYKKVERFLKDSKLGTDLNKMFAPYSIIVETVYSEKLFFTSRKELYFMSKVETDTTNVPDRILDCMTTVTLRKR